VTELEAQKAALQAQLDEDAATNAEQLETIKNLTVRLLSLATTRWNPSLSTLPLLYRGIQETAAADTEELDALEEQCLELSAELKDKEDKLGQIQEIERKCSREYIAYEKAKAKAQRAKEAKKKDFGKFG
jgi:hypothetical protein